MKRTQLNRFDATKNLDRGRSKPVEFLWYLCKWFFFLTPVPWPNRLQLFLLRAFGAEVGKGINIKPRVNIHLPWKLVIGDYAWIGEEVFILNFEKVKIGANACISQRAFLCTGNHDFRAEDFAFRNRPIAIGDGAWVGANVFVGPGVTVGLEAVVTAGSVVYVDLPDNMICTGNPCKPRKQRWLDE
jgi:putative colanic acid biosynthesis acetyltransferase WcaF